MSSHRHHENLTRIKEAVNKTEHLSESEKSDTIKRLDEWVLEDKAEGIFYEELSSITQGMKSVLKELGFL